MNNPLYVIGWFLISTGVVSLAFGVSLAKDQFKKAVVAETISNADDAIKDIMPTISVEGDQTIEIIRSSPGNFIVRVHN